MAYVIAEPCVDVMDQACTAVCPVDCITALPGPDRKLYIDPGACIDCGSCASVCAQRAIYHETELPDGWRPYATVDATWFADPDAARSLVDELVA